MALEKWIEYKKFKAADDIKCRSSVSEYFYDISDRQGAS